MLKQINFNLEAVTYLRSCLAQGDTISHYLLDLPLEQGKISTFLPDTVNLSTIKNFETGGVTKKQQTYLTVANLICSYFKSNENSVAIFEAIEQLGDTCLALFPKEFITYRNEAYYIIRHEGYTLEQIKHVLSRARAYPFIGILTCNSILSYSQLESNELKELAINADYILVGAYDDEGVLIWHKNSHYPKLLQETSTESKSKDLNSINVAFNLEEKFMSHPQTLFEKIWNNHVVAAEEGNPAVIYIDLHLIHEVTSPQAFTGLRQKGLKMRRPDKTMATMDHGIPTTPLDVPITDEMVLRQISQLELNCAEFGIPLQGLRSPHRGIVHVIGPELGLTQPGMTIVCGDSHTSTHGAFGALAFGIGTSEIEHVLATQCLLQTKPKTYAVKVEGTLAPGVSAKDIILNLISRIGIGGGTGYVFEYMGSAIRNLSMEERMTICNMSIEGGARAGMVAPDETTFAYIKGRPHAPQGAAWDEAVAAWSKLPSDEGAVFDKEITIDANSLEPMITYGTNPGMGMKITDIVPDPATIKDVSERQTLEKALQYMALRPGQPLLGQKVDVVFLGSCTNSRISDLRLAAGLIKGRKVADNIRMMVVPGSQEVKKQAEMEGLDQVFKEAGADWREAGCSMCIAMNGDQLDPGQYAVSTSNRNFEGRQGKGGRTFLASPLTAVATAVTGHITDVRTLLS